MTRDEIIRMAREAGIETVLPAPLGQIESLERFANLVAAAEREQCKALWQDLEIKDQQIRDTIAASVMVEREECAKLCERVTACQNDGFDDSWEHGIEHGAKRCAELIRTRSGL